MEISKQSPAKIPQDQSRMPAQKDERNSVAFSPFQLARQAKRFSDCSLEEIRQTLRYIIVVTSLKTENIPQAEEKAVIISFLLDYFGMHTIEEIQLAFKLWAARRLDLEENQIPHYQQLSCEFIGRVMAAYRRWAVREDALIKHKPIALQLENRVSKEVDWKPEVNEAYQEFLTDKWKFRLMVSSLHNQLVKDHLIDSDGYTKLFSIAKNTIRTDMALDRGPIADSEIIFVAKQIVVRDLFTSYRHEGKTEIYHLEKAAV